MVKSHEIFRHGTQILCLISVKSSSLDCIFEFVLTDFGKILWGGIFLKQNTRYDVHPFVSALCRKNRSNQKLEGSVEFQLAMSIRISLFKFLDNRLNAFLNFHSWNFCHVDLAVLPGQPGCYRPDQDLSAIVQNKRILPPNNIF